MTHAPALPVVPPEEAGLSPAGLARLSDALQSRIDAGHIPGAVALIARRGRIGYLRAFGRRDPAAPDPMTDDAIFRIYSMTKPIVSTAAMMLWEEGRFLLSDPLAKYIPEFGAVKLADGRAPARAITIQDLLRHTSGLTYEFRGAGPVHQAYGAARIARRNQTNAEQAAALAALPLLHEPGTRWEYSRSTDVLGRVVEVIAGEPLDAVLSARVLAPLGMTDTGFFVPPSAEARLAGGFAKDPDTGADVLLLDVRESPRFLSGGGGMVGTAADYARFLAMLLDRGSFAGQRLLGRKTLDLMTADHLGGRPAAEDLLAPGHGFGLGFAVRLAAGMAPFPGSVGSYFWGGAAGTAFWVDPAERMTAVLMIQAPGQREHYRLLFRALAYAALAD
ncbi:MAG: beta-lactamase family protein [Rhodospirillales bacterium]|nr:beta-lactamase family protein [Rhodospirillales bacterium]